MADKRKLIVVANRGPLSYARDADGTRVTKRGGGGLVTALRGLVTQHNVTWIGSAITDEDRAVAAENGHEAFPETWEDGSPYRLRLIEHERIDYDRYYNVVANPTLWFVHHRLWNLAYGPDFDLELHEAWTNGYARVNRSFADAVVEELEREPEATVFFHDYHLYLAPGYVRERKPDALLAHFVHIPWPEADAWTVLPPALRVAVHGGLLANDVVGFHTERWRRNFLRACEAVVGATADDSVVAHAGRRTRVTAHPISVDPVEFERLRDAPAVLEQEASIVERRPEFVVLRVDRTDLSKNIVRGFRAYGLFLELNPDFRERVTLLALLDPSRQDVPEYAEYLAAVEREARLVNERFRTRTWLPVDLQVADNFMQSVAAYKQYDALLVNPVFDGLNLVSKEAPLVNARDGVLILSENAGSYEELDEWVIGVNPFDVYGQAQAIHAALTMPAAERRRRLQAIREHVRTHDLGAWVSAQLADFDQVPASAYDSAG
jgi:trehalose 6-phosphate synthase